MSANVAAYGLYRDRRGVDEAVDTLRLGGFQNTDISVPIMALLAGVGVGGSVGSIVGALIGMGVPEYEAKRYEGRIREGGILFSVHCDSSEWVTHAKDLLLRTGAEHIASAGEAKADHLLKDKPADVAS